jgi:NYN domain
LTNQQDSLISTAVIASRETASTPSATAGGVSISEASQALRAALYVDGFNLYHAIDDLGQPHLKWLNLADLGNRIIPRERERLVKVRWFTAVQPRAAADKNRRHREYITALKYYNVAVHRGHFIFDTVDCHNCSHQWVKPQEKETDVGVALHLFDDAYQNVFDVAYLLTADSDQGATARIMKGRFPEKRLVSVVPPGMEPSNSILTHTPHKLKLTVEFLEDCLLPPHAFTGPANNQSVAFRRPPEYAPPPGWLPPRERRKRSKNSN